MDLSIVIVNYKTKDKIKSCLESIKQSDLIDINYEIIVVDNNSGDNLIDLKTQIIDFKLIQSKVNVGMGGGNNLGINEAQGPFVLILNPDIILKPQAIKILYNYIKNNPEVYIVGPKLLNIDLSLQYSCSHFPGFFTPVLRRTFLGRLFPKYLDWFLMKNSSHDIIQEVDWLMGSCLIIRKEGFLGFDDKNFFMYFEDVDVCRRAKKIGKKVIYNPEAEVIHYHARESAKHPWYISIFKDKITQEHIKSWFKYFKKWGWKRK
ncbi:MAG TPA: glycosyltransferase family 2 protein [bacterium]|nr:glycosyltransferase family 2 protein [bacterium]